MSNPEEVFVSLLGGGVLMMMFLHLAVKSGWLAEFLASADKPTDDTPKKQADELLPKMDANAAEHKERGNT